MKKATASLTRSIAELLPTTNRKDGATSTGVGPGKKYEVRHEFIKDRKSERTNPTVNIREDARERKLPGGPVGMGVIGVAKLRTVGIVMSTAVFGSSRMFVAKKIDLRNSQRIVLGNYRKKRKRRYVKDKRHIPIALVLCSPSPLSSSESKTLVSSDPSLEDKSISGPRVIELGMDEVVTTNEEQSFIA